MSRYIEFMKLKREKKMKKNKNKNSLIKCHKCKYEFNTTFAPKLRHQKRLYPFVIDTFGETKTDIKMICEIYETMIGFPKTWSE